MLAKNEQSKRRHYLMGKEKEYIVSHSISFSQLLHSKQGCEEKDEYTRGLTTQLANLSLGSTEGSIYLTSKRVRSLLRAWRYGLKIIPLFFIYFFTYG